MSNTLIDGQTNGWYRFYYIPAMRSMNSDFQKFLFCNLLPRMLHDIWVAVQQPIGVP